MISNLPKLNEKILKQFTFQNDVETLLENEMSRKDLDAVLERVFNFITMKESIKTNFRIRTGRSGTIFFRIIFLFSKMLFPGLSDQVGKVFTHGSLPGELQVKEGWQDSQGVQIVSPPRC